MALLFVVPFAVVALAACGNPGAGHADPGSSGRTSTPAEATSPSQATPRSGEDGGESAYQGSIKLTDSVLEFTVEHCHFDPEEMGNRNIRLVVDGSGLDDSGQRFHVELVSVFDGSRRLERLRVAFAGERRIEARHTVDGSSAASRFAFDGRSRSIAGSLVADVVHGDQRVTTTDVDLQATCPPFPHVQGDGVTLP